MTRATEAAAPTSGITRGYLEGYYGRLLDWPARHAILDTLAALGMNAYVYAPKEDARHRLRWREPYDAAWRDAFAAFCEAASARGIDVVAGVAPGLDFDFAALEGGDDLEAARAKLEALRADGATRLMLLMDDIDADFHRRSGGLASEGEAHARLANRLGERLGAALVVVPRVYATELAADAPDYLPDFARTLDPGHAVSVCGRDIVAREVSLDDCSLPRERAVCGVAEEVVRDSVDGEGAGEKGADGESEAVADGVVGQGPAPAAARRPRRETILWDNLYANDYCPRRLFVGPWLGRAGIDNVWLNATGLPTTDRLLLELMAIGTSEDPDEATLAALERHGVPPAFRLVAEAFRHPASNDRLDAPHGTLRATPEVLAALDELLWRWKTALSREWYPYLFGLRHDLLIADGALPGDRVRKTQTLPLARALLAPNR